MREGQRTFERFCLDDLRAFESDEDLEDQFDQLFDGMEVLPKTLLPEFERLAADAPLEAQGLLVPVTRRQFAALRRRGVLQRGPERTWVANVPYDAGLGLRLDAVAEEAA